MFDPEVSKTASRINWKMIAPPWHQITQTRCGWSFLPARCLPTDQLLHPEIDSNKFRNIISHQFIEIRLIKSKGNELHSSREQMDALVKFQSFSSGYTHFAGAPGTGKSTLLHMACAHRLAEDLHSVANLENSPKRKSAPSCITFLPQCSVTKQEARSGVS